MSIEFSFVDKCKLYFSSLSARLCRYLYLNVPGYENKLIISNANTYDFAQYRPFYCSIHSLKDRDFVSQLKYFLKVDKTPYIFRSEFILKAFLIDDEPLIRIEYNDKGFAYIYTSKSELPIELVNKKDEVEMTSDTKESQEDNKRKVATEVFSMKELDVKTVMGSRIRIPYALDNLIESLDSMHETIAILENYEYPNIYKRVEEIPKVEYINSNWYKSDTFLTEELLPDTEYTSKKQYMSLFDCYDNPSFKEFFNKLTDKRNPYTCVFEQWLYCKNEKYINCITQSTDKSFSIISKRPFADCILLKERKHVNGSE